MPSWYFAGPERRMGPGLISVAPPPGGTLAQNFLARATGMDTAHNNAFTTMLDGFVTDGLDLLGDAAYMLATDTAAHAQLNMLSTSYSLTPTGSPTFTADTGYVGGTTTNLNTGFNASTAVGAKYTQNSCSAFIWSVTNFTSGVDYGAALGLNSAATDADIYPHFSDDVYYLQAQSALGTSITGSNNHFYGFSRTSSAVSPGYKDIFSGGADHTSSALVNANFVLLNDISNSRPFSGSLAFAWLGAGLDATQEANLYGRVHVFLQALGYP